MISRLKDSTKVQSPREARPHSVPATSLLIVMDVEQFRHFVQICMFLSVLDNLQTTTQVTLTKIYISKRNHSSGVESHTFLAMGILLNTFHRMMPTTTLSLR